MWRIWTNGWGPRAWWQWVIADGFPMFVAWKMPRRGAGACKMIGCRDRERIEAIRQMSAFVEIQYQHEGRCLWHTNCPENTHHSGIMRVVRHEPKRSLLECLHCGQHAYFPVGGVCVRASAEPKPLREDADV